MGNENTAVPGDEGVDHLDFEPDLSDDALNGIMGIMEGLGGVGFGNDLDRIRILQQGELQPHCQTKLQPRWSPG